MVRLFERHLKRKVFSIDGIWRFRTDPGNKGISEKWFDAFPQDGICAVVPSCWNNELGLYDYEGIAWYTTTFRISCSNINLNFEAVTGQADIYLDGNHLGGHYGGFSCFNFTAANLSPGEHRLTVRIDNTHNDIDTIPLAKVDWFHYGGIIRSVEVAELEDWWISDCRIGYLLSEDLKDAKLAFDIGIKGFLSAKEIGRLNIYVDGACLFSQEINLENAVELKVEEYVLENIRLWDIGAPNLYLVRFELEINGVVIDDLSERIGFRDIKTANGKLLLNGRELRLKGVNRHEDHPDWGFAMPLNLMKKDMDIIKDMGCNTVRGSHYPNSKAFLDICDQEGIVFWEEIPMWQFHDRHFTNPAVVQRGLQMHEEMVRRDYHHPCIILWGMHNEVDTNCQSAYEATKKFVERIKELDSSRPTTFATHMPMEDICLKLVDVISVNKYYGWYEGDLDSWLPFLKNLKENLAMRGLSDKPLIISEFGAAAIFGDHTFEAPKWTENYQEKYLDFTLKLFINDPDISGMYIWQYSDIRSAKELEMNRARSFNNKGVLNEYRKPKLAYRTVKKIFTS